ncbi:hypothetical protein HDV57DRAFT_478823 [Trichoderma longibrachiatum]|uniref:Zn(2)-C6 fungal-type domain-containing protein n=1 Tax=Trichoderma longibrachiatum ATCC 18648 TaxID=983965 RepID=A0A2T4CK42_TRILO|nr:hypothetical protein M440DRAFT_1427692 [Trichoderma longibrachiatum ATCC 18648]
MEEPSPVPTVNPLPHRVRRMRKGTRSCTECRRRKTRCVFSPGDPVCVLCKSRDGRCIEQGYEDASLPGPRPSAQRKGPTNGKASQSRSGISADQPPKFCGDEETSDVLASERADHAPIVSLLVDAQLSATAKSGQDEASSSTTAYSSSTYTPLLDKCQKPSPWAIQPLGSKSAYVCSTIRSMLPSYDTIVSVLLRNGSWWDSFRSKAYAISEAPSQTIEAFAKRTYTSSNPADIGALAIAFARSLDKHRYLYTLVDDLVISDINYLTTIEGLECLILLAKSYTDCGQPKRAWLVWRKGASATQLMGLCCGRNYTRTEMRLWCAVYHGDRFCSMLLGLPYVLNDNHYQSVIQAPGMTPGFYFVLRCAIICGKIIDRNMTVGKPSFAKAMELDEEMETIASSQPQDWWSVPKSLDQLPEPLELNDLREKLLQQFYFYWVKLFLHLPFLVETTTSSPHYFSRTACIEAAKQILQRYRLLRSKMKSGHCLFECKTTDFACFTAAVVLLIGTFHSSAACRSSDTIEEDLELVADTDRLLMAEEVENDCRVAAQCRKVLQMLSIMEPDEADEDREVVIPYFGAVIRKRSHRTQPDPRHATLPRSVGHASNDLGEVDVPPPPPYNSAEQTAAIPAVDNPWSLNGFSLEYISHRGFERANLGGFLGVDDVACSQEDESTSYMASAAMDWDPGWSVLTDIGGDFMTGIEDLSAEDFEF